jgi:hypothetical protein
MAYAPPGPPLVQAHFKIFAEGLSDGWCTKAKVPQPKPMKTEVQSAGSAQKTKFPSGLSEYDDMEISLILGDDGHVGQWLATWLAQHTNAETGQTGVVPEAVKRTITVQQLKVDGVTVVHEHECIGCFLVDPGSIDLEAGKADGVMRDLKLSVDYVRERL